MRKPNAGLFRLYRRMEREIGMQKNAEFLEQEIGYTFQDKMLLKRALTHTSFANEQRINKNGHYERLEFLGDAVLELLTSEYLYVNYPEMVEGDMTKFRSAIVCETSLAKSAAEIPLSDYIFLGRGEDATGGRMRDSIVSDVLEALLGAIYIDGGMKPAKEFVEKYILKDLEDRKLFYDAKSSLQEMVQKDKKGPIHYVLLGENGPEHNKVFQCAVNIGTQQMGIGEGKNKKEAEQKAAMEAIKLLKK